MGKNLRRILKQLLTEGEQAEVVINLAEQFYLPGGPFVPGQQLGEDTSRQCWGLKVKIRLFKRTVYWERPVEVTTLTGKNNTLWRGNFVKAERVNQIFTELEWRKDLVFTSQAAEP